MKTAMFGGALSRGVLVACLMWSLAPLASAQPAEVSSAAESPSRSEVAGVPVAELIAAVAKRTGRKFLIDPRVRANVNLVGFSPSSVSYAELLTILHVYGFVAVEQGGIVSVVPDAAARTVPSPLLTEWKPGPSRRS